MFRPVWPVACMAIQPTRLNLKYDKGAGFEKMFFAKCGVSLSDKRKRALSQKELGEFSSQKWSIFSDKKLGGNEDDYFREV